MAKPLLLTLMALMIGSAALPPASAEAESRCPSLRAKNGKCVDPLLVEDAQNRAMIVSTVRNSYFGTPIGTIGGAFIPFERLFRDNPAVFGLPTYNVGHVGEGGVFINQKTK
jgi:hypothetical protein